MALTERHLQIKPPLVFLSRKDRLGAEDHSHIDHDHTQQLGLYSRVGALLSHLLLSDIHLRELWDLEQMPLEYPTHFPRVGVPIG